MLPADASFAQSCAILLALTVYQETFEKSSLVHGQAGLLMLLPACIFSKLIYSHPNGFDRPKLRV